ncbi:MULTISPECIES: hypothetical protein [unclassified Novosphingobium]|uniref:hypothetical protein n=1 Tax=unclassified Novosphingobium TaxID=2644732 RepID=UPI00105BB416|nr:MULTISPECIES: hypothetical protein [unclassified Novosphingobium]
MNKVATALNLIGIIAILPGILGLVEPRVLLLNSRWKVIPILTLSLLLGGAASILSPEDHTPDSGGRFVGLIMMLLWFGILKVCLRKSEKASKKE